MKKIIRKLALWLHPKSATVLRAAHNVRAGQKDSEPLRIAMRFFMLSWNGVEEYGEARTIERKQLIERFYCDFSTPTSGFNLALSCDRLLGGLIAAGRSGMVYVPSEEDRKAAKEKGIDLYNEADSYIESVRFLRRLRKAALNPWLYSAVYSED